MPIIRGTLCLIALALASWAPIARAGSVDLVRDINAQVIPVGSSPQYLGAAGSRAVFTTSTQPYVKELWSSDGTEAGTIRLYAPSASEGLEPSNPVTLGNQVLFANVAASITGKGLWRTDGTAAGTIHLFDLTSPSFGWLETVGGVAYFSFSRPGDVAVLGRTDGTLSGTKEVAVLGPGYVQGHPRLIGSNLYFISGNPLEPSKRSVYVTDGTEGGTRAIYTPTAGALAGPDDLIAFQGDLLVKMGNGGYTADLYLLHPGLGAITQLTSTGTVVADFSTAQMLGSRLVFNTDNDQLWATDGTPAGTAPFTAIGGFQLTKYPPLNGQLILSSYESASGSELWVTDGTASGTRLLKDLTPGPEGSVRFVAATSTRLFVVASGTSASGNAKTLWVTDGTEAGTQPVPLEGGETYIGDEYFAGYVAGQNVFIMGQNIYGPSSGAPVPVLVFTRVALDGSSARRVLEGPVGGGEFQPVLDRLFFSGYTVPTALEPWLSDGTAAGTRMIKDIGQAQTNGDAHPHGFAALGNTVLFSADDGLHGAELWKTDGTAAGTVLVKDIANGSGSSSPERFSTVNGLVWFYTHIVVGPPNSAHSADQEIRIWRSDGTDAGTFSVGLLAESLPGDNTSCDSWIAPLGNRAVFAADVNGHYGLWSSDGTVQGTSLILDLSARVSAPSRMCQLTQVGSQLLFSMRAGGTRQLWRTDGTADGTVLLDVINPNGSSLDDISQSLGSPPFAVLKGLAYFQAQDATGWHLWRSDGTRDGTRRAVVLPGSDAHGEQVDKSVVLFKGEVYFGGTVNDQYKWSVYATDGTSVRILKSGLGAFFLPPVVTGDHLFFFEPLASSMRIWCTDGTPDGTRGGAQQLFSKVAGQDGVIFFLVGQVNAGTELWTSDGTLFGTQRVKTFALGPNSSEGELTTLLPGLPLVSGLDAAAGIELFVLHNNVPPVAVDDTASLTAGSSLTGGASLAIAVNANDKDPDGNALLASPRVSSLPANGMAAEQPDGRILYTPRLDFTGTDTFDYILTDSEGASSAPARVTVTVNPATAPTSPTPPSNSSGSTGGGGGGAVDELLLAMLLACVVARLRASAPPQRRRPVMRVPRPAQNCSSL